MDADWEKPILKWREDFERSRRAPYGWLSLVGLDFLEPGENPIGSSKAARVRLPASCLPNAGVLTLEDNRIFFTAAPGANVRWRGHPVLDPVPLAADDDDSYLELGKIRIYLLRRGDRHCVRLKDPAAETRRDYAGAEWFPAKHEWVLEGQFRPSESPRTIEAPNALGGVDPVLVPGVVEFSVNGAMQSLAVQGSEENGFFIVFGDATNGTETYPPGRFITTPPPRQRKVVLDFNRAYNPPCALTPFATCPYPPAENRLSIAVEAGERFRRPG